MRSLGKIVILVAFFGLLPALAYSQASITGAVRDTSGAVLPGVTVEAASPALIEKVRTVVTDGTGQYRIENLRPGTYSVTFALPGFSTVRREGVELQGAFVATINADMKVGAVEETLTVRAESPIVDVQSTSRQRVFTQDVVNALPSGRNSIVLVELIPGVRTGVQGDVGGVKDPSSAAASLVHGSQARDGRLEINGLSLTLVGPGTNYTQGNMSAYQEVTVDTSGISAETNSGGVRINQIPREGGNSFKGTFFAGYINESWQGDNFSQDLRNTLGKPNIVKRFLDVNPGFGGPIKQDTLWFFVAYKNLTSENYPSGVYLNENANNPNAWTYVRDLTSRPFNHVDTWDLTGRVTWQAMPRVKLGFSHQEVRSCSCSDYLGGGVTAALTANVASPEAADYTRLRIGRHTMIDGTAPLTNRLLIDFGVLSLRQDFSSETAPGQDPRMIRVVDQALNNFAYRAAGQTGTNQPLRDTFWQNWQGRAMISYITGAHALKTGLTTEHRHETDDFGINLPPGGQRVEYRFNNGVPNQITLLDFPLQTDFTQTGLGLFVQDRWTIRRMTVSGALRYDYWAEHVPARVVGPTPLVPNRNLSFPESTPVKWQNLSPRLGLAYDVFGTGKTALKVGLNKYLTNYVKLGQSLNPATLLVTQTTRNWNDVNRDYVPQCGLTESQANGECGPLDNQNFGKPVPGTAYDPDLLTGWGRRGFNWEFSAGVQHEVLPRVSVEVSYFRRWWGNFFATDNLATTPSDYTSFSITVPNDPNLPTAGQTLSGYYNVNPNKVGQVNNFVTRYQNYGDWSENWQGLDFLVNARLADGLTAQGGVSVGGARWNRCDIRAKVPEMWLTDPFCDVSEPWKTSMKGMLAYTLPRIDVQVSGVFKRDPAPASNNPNPFGTGTLFGGATFVASNALVAPSLGRPLSGGAANVTVTLTPPTFVANYINTLDFRVGKILPMGRVRASVNLDMYNVLNSADALTVVQTFGGQIPWLTPLSVLRPRLIKISTQIDF